MFLRIYFEKEKNNYLAFIKYKINYKKYEINFVSLMKKLRLAHVLKYNSHFLRNFNFLINRDF